MRVQPFAALLLAVSVDACVVYEYEHEFWLHVDGSGTVIVTGRQELWPAFKKLGRPDAPQTSVSREAIREVFERSGLRVRRVARTRRAGHTFLLVVADFTDVNGLSGSPAFPDLDIRLVPENDRLRLVGVWRRPADSFYQNVEAHDGLVAVRFHLPSKVYEHRNAYAGVQRGNIVGWRESLANALDMRPLELGIVIDRRSILSTTLAIFIGSIVAALTILASLLYLVFRSGRRRLRAAQGVAAVANEKTDARASNDS